MSEQSPNNTAKGKRKSGVKQSSEVRFSDRGFAYAETGSNREATGLVQSFSEADKPLLANIPPGIVILNRDTQNLEVSDPDNNQWLIYAPSGTSSSSISGIIGSGTLGLPTDGTFSDGAVAINPSGSIVDAIDSLNEYMGTLTSGTGSIVGPANLYDTTFFNGTNFVPNSSLQSDGTDVFIENSLSVSGAITLSSGTAPVFSGSAGSIGEFRWNDNFLYIKTALGWARTTLTYF